MIQVNSRAIGLVRLYKEGMSEVKKVEKEQIQKKVEEIQVENKEMQLELTLFIALLPTVKTLGLGNRKEKRVDIYIDSTSFGRKKPEYIIAGNYPLYNMLKKLIE